MRMHLGTWLLALALLVVLFTKETQAQTTWSDGFNHNITDDPAIDNSWTVDVKWTGSSIIPTVNPSTVPTYTLDIVGFWSFDSINETTTPDISDSHIDAVINNATFLPSGGRFGGAFQFSDRSQYLFISPSPLDIQLATITGFSASVWVKLSATSQAPIFERMYNAFEVGISNENYYCTTRDSSDISCTYSPLLLEMALYINGSLVGTAPSNLTTNVYFGDGSNLGVGSRPFTGQASINGIIDEFIFYAKTLSTKEVLTLAQLNEPFLPYRGPSFRSTVLPFTTTADYWDVTPFWQLSGSSSVNSSDVIVQISTNRGISWCTVVNNTNFGSDQLCRLPANSLTFRVTFQEYVAIDFLSFTFLDTEPQRNWKKVPICINRGGFNYYAVSWMFVDYQKSAYSPPMTYSFDANFYPQNITSSNEYEYLVASSNGPPGNYTVFAKGQGQIGVASPRGGLNTLNVPADIPSKAKNPWQAGIKLSQAANPISEISIVMPGFEGNYTTAPFHPLYVSQFDGVVAARFMDSLKTNGNNIAHWSDRTLTTSFTQDLEITTLPFLIQSIVDASSTPSNFSAEVKWTSGGTAQTPFPLNMQALVEVLSATTFYFRYSDHDSWLWGPKSTGRNTVVFSPANNGHATVTVSSGIALEHIVELAVTQQADPWINIPVLANDDYVTQLAKLLFAQLPSQYSAYIEFSNEIWNMGFSQTSYCEAMGAAMGADAPTFIAKRLAEIFTIFESVFGKNSPRIVKILPGFASGSNWGASILAKLNDTTWNPNQITMDVLSMAPYFGQAVGGYIGDNKLMNTITEDEILDMVRDNLWNEVQDTTLANFAVAEQYGLTLVAYEGGQSLDAPIWYTGPAYQNLTNLLTSANRNPRMKDLYKQMFWLWSQSGGELFCLYSDIGEYSEWGSWGLLEYQDQPLNISYKYQAVLEMIEMYHSKTTDSHKILIQN